MTSRGYPPGFVYGEYLSLKKMGIEHVQSKVGDRYVLEEMQKKDAIIGGEESGHIIFLDHHTSGDGILSALQLLYVLKNEKKACIQPILYQTPFAKQTVRSIWGQRSYLYTILGSTRL